MKNLARCIFNQSAEDRFLQNDVIGLQFRIIRDVVHFRPVQQKTGRNVLPLDFLPSQRRSMDIPRSILNGKFEDMLESNPEARHFILHEGQNGWIRVNHVRSEGSPKLPFARIWPTHFTEQPINGHHMKIKMAHRVVLEALATVHEYKLGKHVGRPPKSVKEAQTLVAAYQAIIPEIEKRIAPRAQA